MSSSQYIGAPTILKGKYADEIFFITGQYDSDLNTNPVLRRSLAVLRDGRVINLSGPTFSTLSSFDQIDDDQFLGVTFSYKLESSEYIELIKNSELVEISILDIGIKARPADVGKLALESVSSTASLSALGITVIQSIDYSRGGGRPKLTVVENGDIHNAKSYVLEPDLNIGSLFASGPSTSGFLINFFAADKQNNAFLADFDTKLVQNLRPIQTLITQKFDTENCRKN